MGRSVDRKRARDSRNAELKPAVLAVLRPEPASPISRIVADTRGVKLTIPCRRGPFQLVQRNPAEELWLLARRAEREVDRPAVADDHAEVRRPILAQALGEREVREILPKLLLERSQDVHDGANRCDGQHHVSKPQCDRQLEEVPFREHATRTPAGGAVDIRDDDALLAEVDQSMLRDVQPASDLRERERLVTTA